MRNRLIGEDLGGLDALLATLRSDEEPALKQGQSRAKKETPAKDFKAMLWASGDKLRAQMEAADDQHLVLGLDFRRGRLDQCSAIVAGFANDLRRLLIELLQPLPAEVDIENFITRLWSLGMAPRPGASCLGRSQRSRVAEVLVHQSKSSTGDERKADQINCSQKVVQGFKNSFCHPTVKKC